MDLEGQSAGWLRLCSDQAVIESGAGHTFIKQNQHIPAGHPQNLST